MTESDKMIAILRQEVTPAIGCTEPAAVALACAYAARTLGESVKKAEVLVSANILKNGMGVGIPHTVQIGLEIAAAFGIYLCDTARDLELFSALKPEHIAQANALIASGDLCIKLADTKEKVWIEARVTGTGNTAAAIIRWRHNWLYQLQFNGQVIEHNEINDAGIKPYVNIDHLSIRDIYAFCDTVDANALKNLELGLTINRRIAGYGLEQKRGIGVGKTIMIQMENGLIGNDIHHYAMALTAAATDARMSGCTLPVISNSGSGNQGLSLTLPIIAVAEKSNSDEEKLIRALALGHLISIHIKSRIGILSCLCGCLSAASAAAGGIVYLLGGNLEQVIYAIKNMIGNTAGMVCDGAKEGCSLKVATNTSAAVQAALLALNEVCISSKDGIITDDIEETINNLAELVYGGMSETDLTILQIMMKKRK